MQSPFKMHVAIKISGDASAARRVLLLRREQRRLLRLLSSAGRALQCLFRTREAESACKFGRSTIS